jgi:C_GCAxxG_C_C family probable redox protein
MTRTEQAVEIFKKQFNCSQAVFTAFRQADKLDEETALKLATVFGAGVAGTGSDLCGAVTGALMALSMKHGRGDLPSVDAKARTYELGRRFMAEFERGNGSCVCERILGINIGTPQGLEKARAGRLFETRCLDAVRSAAQILEEIL